MPGLFSARPTESVSPVLPLIENTIDHCSDLSWPDDAVKPVSRFNQANVGRIHYVKKTITGNSACLLLAIPKVVRETLKLKAGQKFSVIAKDNVIELVPVPSLKSMRGILKGGNTEDYRDRQGRV